MRVAQQSARHKDMVSLSHRNIQHMAQYPETFPNAVQRFFAGLTAAINPL
jgi:hypothetical protein